MQIFSKIKKRAQPTSLSADVHLKAPFSWGELSQDQLRYVLELLTLFPTDKTKVKTYMFLRFCRLTVLSRVSGGWKLCTDKHRIFFLNTDEVNSLLCNFDFIDSFENMSVRLERIQSLKAVDMQMHGIAFIDYLNAERIFQGYLANNNRDSLVGLMHILYRPEKRTKKKIRPSEAELLGVFVWYAFIVKKVFRNAFPDLFRPAPSGNAGQVSMVDSINAQIRALTEGDITKEKEVLKLDCWRALTELNAKAKEAEEMKRIMDNNEKKRY